MTIKKEYKTKHREELMEFMESIPGKHITAGEICMCMKNKGSTIGTATVYRQLEKLVSDGVLAKYVIDEGSSACYEFIPDNEEANADNCCHLKCSECGRLIHLECHEVQMLTEHISSHHSFKIDPRRTVFYGVCAECAV